MAKYQMIKLAGGTFVPAFEFESTALQKFKNNEQYEVEIKNPRNPQFHKKVFAFFNFCFEHWSADKTDWKYFDEKEQFNRFRKDLTILAGYKVVTYKLDGSFNIEAKTLKYSGMEQDEFERCYTALIQAAMDHVFKGCNDDNIINRLYAFF